MLNINQDFDSITTSDWQTIWFSLSEVASLSTSGKKKQLELDEEFPKRA